MFLDIPIYIARNDSVVFKNSSGYSIKGCVREIGIPFPCRVRLFEKLSGLLVSDVLTNENGFYEFNNLAKTKFFLVAHHPASIYNAVIQDNVVPK